MVLDCQAFRAATRLQDRKLRS